MNINLIDGQTFDAARDGARLSAQLDAVKALMADSSWRTLAQIADAVKAPEASVSARLRDLRKPKHGAFLVEREHVSRGLFRYRVSVQATGQGELFAGARNRPEVAA